MLSAISFVILTSNKSQSRISDEDVLQIVKETLEIDELRNYEVISIVRIQETNTTTVLVESSITEFAIEIDDLTCKVISKEKLIL